MQTLFLICKKKLANFNPLWKKHQKKKEQNLLNYSLNYRKLNQTMYSLLMQLRRRLLTFKLVLITQTNIQEILPLLTLCLLISKNQTHLHIQWKHSIEVNKSVTNISCQHTHKKSIQAPRHSITLQSMNQNTVQALLLPIKFVRNLILF